MENLAYACRLCNLYKGTDLATLDPEGRIVNLFNPRKDSWTDHFRFDGPVIRPLTPIGIATARLLRFNEPERIAERRAFLE